MKRIILIITTIVCFTSCDQMVHLAIEAVDPDPLLSFQANGEKFEVTGSNTRTLRIHEVDEDGFAIIFSGGSNWDTENTLNSAVISLNCGFFGGNLKKGNEYVFTSEELDTYPYFKYTINVQQESSSGSLYYEQKTMWYNCTEGRISITKMNKKRGRISGRFEFTAVCDDPSNGDVIEITDGVFKDISYTVTEEEE